MAIAWEDIQQDIPKCRPYDEMILAAIGAINDVGGSSEETISTFISSCYIDLPLNHLTRVNENLKKLIHEGLIGITCAYSIKQLNDSFSDHAVLSSMIVKAIKTLNETGGSSEYSISKYIVDRVGNESSKFSSHMIKLELQKLVEDGIIGINNFYFLLPPGEELFNGMGKDVPYRDDDSLCNWRRCRNKLPQTTRIEGNISGIASRESEAKIKEKSKGRKRRETEPETWMTEEWTTSEISCVTGDIPGTALTQTRKIKAKKAKNSQPK